VKKLRILTLILTLLVSVTACIPGQSVNFVTVDEIKDSLPDNSTEKTFVVGVDIEGVAQGVSERNR
jgi:hypothetical protein